MARREAVAGDQLFDARAQGFGVMALEIRAFLETLAVTADQVREVLCEKREEYAAWRMVCVGTNNRKNVLICYNKAR